MTSTDFALAQQRLAARRRSREAEARARQVQSHAAQSNASWARLPFPLDRFHHAGLSTWSVISGREGTRPAFRVGQVDAELLDEELLQLLKAQVADALKYLGPHLPDDWSAEILLGLRAVLYKLSVWDHNATYGAALQGLSFVDARNTTPVPSSPSKWQKGFYGLFTVGGKYAWTKWEEWLIDVEGDHEEPSHTTHLLGRLTSVASTAHSIAALISFLTFLLNGRYRTLLDRLLRLRLAPISSQVSREVSFEYLNRQLVWHAFTEFLLFVLPLVGIGRWRRWLARAWRKAKAVARSRRVEEGEKEEKTGELAFLPERTCAICYQDLNPTSTAENEVLALSGGASGGGGVVGSAQTDVTSPYETIPCGCIYCYVCLAQRLETEEGQGWTCLRCGELVKECKPWAGDVSETTSTPERAVHEKRVDFADLDEQGAGIKEMTTIESRPEDGTDGEAFVAEESTRHEQGAS
ncbi:MAG: peroxisome assembly protein (Peroxin-2) [Caeruleum heppii]|nr:MAG: peroxisome assembly protein (Peroxin-2) [Caeruleum heppii]